LRQGFNKTEFVSFNTRQIQSYGRCSYIEEYWSIRLTALSEVFMELSKGEYDGSCYLQSLINWVIS